MTFLLKYGIVRMRKEKKMLIFILIYLVGYVFAFVELIRKDTVCLKKSGSDVGLLIDMDCYVFMSMFSWITFIVAFLIRKSVENENE